MTLTIPASSDQGPGGATHAPSTCNAASIITPGDIVSLSTAPTHEWLLARPTRFHLLDRPLAWPSPPTRNTTSLPHLTRVLPATGKRTHVNASLELEYRLEEFPNCLFGFPRGGRIVTHVSQQTQL
jgi:hypothetical protein